MKTFGLIGYPLGHSFSAKFFAENFGEQNPEMEYKNFAIENIDLIREVLADNPNLKGLNVTIPYKEQIFPYLDSIDIHAQTIGAVNCVKIEDGKLYGYNTDAYGFENSLLELIEGVEAKSLEALVLGTGGASKAINYVLDKNGIKFKKVSREASKGDLTYEQLTKDVVARHRLIINTTPLGMYPKIEGCPELDYQGLTSNHFLFDIVYNPKLTRFLEFGQNAGAKIMYGSQMLVDQALKSWDIWGIK